MPTYQYACTECDHFFEQFQSFTDDALTVCPQCSGKLRKVFNAVGVVFKGSGFYRTDSRSDSGAKGEGSGKEKTAAGSGDAGSTTSSDSGPSAASASTSSGDAKKASSSAGSGSSTPAA
ncbi:MAG: zinc ribbon domain-containing protein [Nocardioidaceae bacterium]